MTLRDRLVVSAILAVVAVGLMWVAVVSPKRAQASSLTTQISAAHGTLQSAEQALVAAHQAESAYIGNVHAVSQLNTAVPRTDDEPGLLTLISRLAGSHAVEFHSVSLGTPAPSTGLSTLELSFSFSATYISLQHFLDAVERLTVTNGTVVRASGRLLTIDSMSLAPSPGHGTQATVTATAYIQPTTTVSSASPSATTTTVGAAP